MKNIIIIGNGISGITAARHLRKNTNHAITIISEESDFFFSRTALMYVYMGHMRWRDIEPYERHFWDKNRLKLVRDRLEEIAPEKKKIHLTSGGWQSYDILILALGSTPAFYNWPGQDLPGVSGLYHKKDLDSLEARSPQIKNAVVVGGGLIGVELAEMLLSRNINTTMLVREDRYWSRVIPKQESDIIGSHITDHGVDLRFGTELVKIHGDPSWGVQAVISSDQDKIDCDYVGICTGVRPNIDVVRKTDIEFHRGILVDQYLQTNKVDIYAIGDCAELRSTVPGRRPIEAIWYSGRKMGQTVARTISGELTAYDPGLWYNSAKFFDIEYQVYGHVPAESNEENSLLWSNEKLQVLCRLCFDKDTRNFVGLNALNMRFRQEVCHLWIREKTDISKVVEDISYAYFDPEFQPYHKLQMQSNLADQLGRSFPDQPAANLSAVQQYLEQQKTEHA